MSVSAGQSVMASSTYVYHVHVVFLLGTFLSFGGF